MRSIRRALHRRGANIYGTPYQHKAWIHPMGGEGPGLSSKQRHVEQSLGRRPVIQNF